jgi:hypothetical protein
VLAPITRRFVVVPFKAVILYDILLSSSLVKSPRLILEWRNVVDTAAQNVPVSHRRRFSGIPQFEAGFDALDPHFHRADGLPLLKEIAP